MNFVRTITYWALTFIIWVLLLAIIHSQNVGLTKVLVGAVNGAGVYLDWNWSALTALIYSSFITFFVLICYRTLTRGSLDSKMDELIASNETLKTALDQARLELTAPKLKFEEEFPELEPLGIET